MTTPKGFNVTICPHAVDLTQRECRLCVQHSAATPVGASPLLSPKAQHVACPHGGYDRAEGGCPRCEDIVSAWKQLHESIEHVVEAMLDDDRLYAKGTDIYDPVGGERGLVELADAFDKLMAGEPVPHSGARAAPPAQPHKAQDTGDLRWREDALRNALAAVVAAFDDPLGANGSYTRRSKAIADARRTLLEVPHSEHP